MKSVWGLGRNVYSLTAVSFFTDVSSEMIYPLLPAFVTSVLGASAGFLGGIEGAAESTAALLKLASGWWSDRVRRRKLQASSKERAYAAWMLCMIVIVCFGVYLLFLFSILYLLSLAT